jgi:SAM-dependent methyltransferase
MLRWHVKNYIREALKLRKENPRTFQFFKLCHFHSPWRLSLRPGASPLEDESPWITFAAREFLEARLRPSMRVFEYGAGGSTLFFFRRHCEVISVEHDPAWAALTKEALLKNQFSAANLRLCPPEPDPAYAGKDPSDLDSYISSAADFKGRSFRKYAGAIAGAGEFDLVMVDGRARPSCFKSAFPKVAPGGLLLLDNAERAHYRRIHDRLNALGWKFHDFAGPGPYNHYFWQSCIWQRPAK